MNFLYILEDLRMPVLNEIMLLVTRFGEETIFLIAALVMFWCVDKRKGYYILSVGLIGTVANQFMKLWFRIPRPWALDENFTILEQAREAASGYSFPSGHTQSAVSTFGGIGYTTKNRWIRNVCAVLVILVPFSRMYLGVHTPMDVLVAAATSIILIVALKPVVFYKDGKLLPYLLAFMTAISLAYLGFVEFYPFPGDVDSTNLASGTENAYTLLGALLGFLIVYIADEKWLHFPVKAVWWAQILKIVLGLLIVLAVKSGLKVPLNLIFGELPGRLVHYFVVVVVAGIVWPLSFRWFGKLGTKEQ